MMSRTLGAPLGAVTPVGNSDLDSLALRPMTPPNCASGTGRIDEPPVGGFSGNLLWAYRLLGSLPEAVSQPSNAPAASTVAAVRIVRGRMVSSPLKTCYGGETEPGRDVATAEVLRPRREIDIVRSHLSAKTGSAKAIATAESDPVFVSSRFDLAGGNVERSGIYERAAALRRNGSPRVGRVK